MRRSETIKAAVDTALLALLSKRGQHSSMGLVLTTAGQAARKWDKVVVDHNATTTAFGRQVLRRWDGLCRDWGSS